MENWRENIHNTVYNALYGHEPTIPQAIIDAIDASYLAGLDDRKALIEEIINDIESNPVSTADGITLQYWIEAKQQQLRDKYLQ